MKIANIQVLRGVAAISVMLFHVAGTQEKEDLSGFLFTPFKNWGSWGVDLFFIISGFVMSNSLNSGKISARNFIIKRFIRIYPLYFILTVLYFLLAVIFPELFPSLQLDNIWFLASITFTSGLLGFGEPLLGQGWTLEFEVLFYLILVLVIYLIPKLRIEFTASIALILCTLFGVNTLVIEFVFGMFISAIKVQVLGVPKYRFATLGLGILGLLVSLFSTSLEFPRLVLLGVPCIFLVIGGLKFSASTNSFLLYLGEISYSIYLVQFFIIPFFFKFFKNPSEIAFFSDLRGIIAIFVTVVASQITYNIIEVRISRFLKKFLKLV